MKYGTAGKIQKGCSSNLKTVRGSKIIYGQISVIFYDKHLQKYLQCKVYTVKQQLWFSLTSGDGMSA